MVGQPQTAKCSCGGHGAENHSAGEARLQQRRFSRPPRHDVIDFERDADAQQQRQCDNIGKIELEFENDT